MQVDAIEQEFNRWIIQEAGEICREIGLGKVPMDNPNFNFYRWGYFQLIWKYKLRGDNLDFALHEILQRIFFPISKRDKEVKRGRENKGTIHKFSEWLADHPDGGFDTYFMINFDQQRRTFARSRKKMKRYYNTPILPGRDMGDPSGISEEILTGGELTGDEIFWQEEADQRRRQIMNQEIPALLAKQRKGLVLLEIWKGMRAYDDLETIAEQLNYRAEDYPEYRPKMGGTWSAGTVWRLRDEIRKFLKGRFGDENLIASHRPERVLYRAKVSREASQAGGAGL